jgi:hypothetical protein
MQTVILYWKAPLSHWMTRSCGCVWFRHNNQTWSCVSSVQLRESQSCKSHFFFVSTSFRTLVNHANRSLGPLRIDLEDYQYDIARWFPHLKVRRRLIQSDNALVMVLTDGKYCTAETVDILIDFLGCSYQLIIAGKIVASEAQTAWMMLTPHCCSPVDSM